MAKHSVCDRMSRMSLLVLACVSVAFARGRGPLDGKNVTISAKGRALCSGAPIQGSVKLILFDTRKLGDSSTV